MGKHESDLWLSLDIGTHMGFVVEDFEGIVEASGAWDFTPAPGAPWGERFCQLHHQLNDLYQTHSGITNVAYEDVKAHRGVAAAHMYGGYLATVCLWCEQEGVVYEGVGVGTIKKHATGKGNASKFDMVKAAFAKWGPEAVGSEDEVDARWLADYITTRVALNRDA